ncbi:hypothetical protein [Alicyclobacillus acidoterrestris]|uniref:MICOS complex subunit MIC60 n=1 Tax=Alicyclobacillus acidoterrestris (strain ATCC 49025 / DSM 3922 / CIP 106132 / NCIMB 13137 / GD3B) TaxID=1356854 RepID=T0D982_ALIAG|nr:hypothetical protein [Alicyclobacillus acidoterrestris]EPZ46261.1 hypothetical protein N007_07135 [Alicyclobacillus acidoterrestris ATCC 49025]UNO47105.1 MICOS complex subunit MIC60 [Alicyclobacillus acidoterrestris]
MREFTAFATRFHKLKRDLQDIEESQYARLLQQERALQLQWQQLEDLSREARGRMKEAASALLVQSYVSYQEAIETRKAHLEREWAALQGDVHVQQGKLRDAYVEQEKWSRISQDARMEDGVERMRKLQVEADDEALKRFKRTDV